MSSKAFITKLTPEASALIYSTFLGRSGEVEGSGNDRGSAIAIDDYGNAYVTGKTLSINFPTTSDAFQKNCATWKTRVLHFGVALGRQREAIGAFGEC